MAVGRWWDEAKNGAVLDAAAPRAAWPIVLAGPLDGPNGARVRFAHVRAAGSACRGGGAVADAPGRDLRRALALRAVRARRAGGGTLRRRAGARRYRDGIPRALGRRGGVRGSGGRRRLGRRVPRPGGGSGAPGGARAARPGACAGLHPAAPGRWRARRLSRGALPRDGERRWPDACASSSTPIPWSPTGTTATRISCAAC